MPGRFVRLARTRLDATDLDLARKPGVTVGCLRELGSQGCVATSSGRSSR